MQDRFRAIICGHKWTKQPKPPPPTQNRQRQKVAAMGANKDQLMKVRVEDGEKAAFTACAKRKGLTPSALLRDLVLSEISKARGTEQVQLSGDEMPERSALFLRLPLPLKVAATKRAKTKGMSVAKWATSLIQSHLSREPVVTDREVIALNAVSRELGAIGRNVNQIAKALNSAIDGIERSRVDLGELEKLSKSIELSRKVIRALVIKSQQSWLVTGEDGDE